VDSVTPVPQPPDLTRPEPHVAPKRVLWKWSLIVSAVVCSFMSLQCIAALSTGGKRAEQAVQHLHAQLDAGDYEGILHDADPAFLAADTHDGLIRFLRGVHTKLGAVRSAERINLFVGNGTMGPYVRTQYKSTFANGTATESFTWRRAGGRFALLGYHVESRVFVDN